MLQCLPSDAYDDVSSRCHCDTNPSLFVIAVHACMCGSVFRVSSIAVYLSRMCCSVLACEGGKSFTCELLLTDPGMAGEVEEDIKEECGKLGEVQKVSVYPQHPDGVVVRLPPSPFFPMCLRVLSIVFSVFSTPFPSYLAIGHSSRPTFALRIPLPLFVLRQLTLFCS